MEENRVIEIKGKHGFINLVVPKRQPSESEWNELHRVVAETIVNKSKKVSKMEKATK